MPQGINVGGIYADLDLNTGNLEQGLGRGRKLMEAIARETKQVQGEFRAGTIAAADLNARLTLLSQTQADLTAKMQAAYAALGVSNHGLDVFNRQITTAGQSSRGFGMGLMQVSYAVDDLQYGLGAVVNNIGPLVYMMGGSAGLAGALQITAVAANVLYKHWDDVKSAFGSATVIDTTRMSLKELTEEAKRLKEATKDGWFFPATGADFKRAQDVEKAATGKGKAAKGFQALEGDTEDEGKAKKRFKEAILEHGGREKVVEQMVDAQSDPSILRQYLNRRDRAKFDQYSAAVEAHRGAGVEPPKVMTERLEGLRARATELLKQNMQDLLGKAMDDVSKQKPLGEMFKKFADPLAGLGKVITGETPTEKEAEEKEKADRKREKDDREDHAETARRIRPGYNQAAEELAAKAVTGGRTREQAIAEMQGRLTAPDAQGRFMNPKEAEVAAKDTVGPDFDRFQGDPAKLKAYNDRAKREAVRAAEEVAKRALPGFDKTAEQTAADALNRGKSREEAVKAMEDRLRAQGVASGSARDAAEASTGKSFDSFRSDPDRLKGYNKQRRREAVIEAEERIPALKDQVETGVAGAMVQGVPMSEVRRQIQTALERRGMGADQAGAAAGALTEDANRSVADQVVKRMMKGDSGADKEVRHSEVFNTASVNQKVQEALTNAPEQQHLDNEKRMIELLATIAQQRGVVVSVQD